MHDYEGLKIFFEALVALVALGTLGVAYKVIKNLFTAKR